ncbi:hypothetical protein AK812_SmicGene44488 [Symbiodinium microadriaticum]|uniref:Uncharacterized protein n=1 Tax=Symbiodinium microadriaticum TaxID=2951 RepID=A0A1Q9BYB4_SYMMI|nr:hypothetical protein AK812_SmicGene44488 [Symbiodinium microadriaticum]
MPRGCAFILNRAVIRFQRQPARNVQSIMSSPTPPDWGGETLQDATPINVPSSPPPADGPGDVTPGFDAPAFAACPVCLERPSPELDVHDTTYPCCGSFTHIGCMLQAARLHGRCSNCRAAIDHLPREPSIATHCRDLGINLDLVAFMELPVDVASHTERSNPLLLLLHRRTNILPMARPKHSFHCRQCCPSRPPATRNLRTRRLPWPVAAEPGGVVQYAEAEPPVPPFAPSTNSAMYVLSRSCWMLRRAWHTHPTIGGWWPTAITKMLARPFLPVPELAHAVEHVGQAFHPSSMRLSPSLRCFREWAVLRHAQVTSLAELVRAIADPWSGHYLAAPLQDAFLTAGYLCRPRLRDVPLPPHHV